MCFHSFLEGSNVLWLVIHVSFIFVVNETEATADHSNISSKEVFHAIGQMCF